MRKGNVSAGEDPAFMRVHAPPLQNRDQTKRRMEELVLEGETMLADAKLPVPKRRAR